eukprot:9492658-Pyramimonas_sp.AAC.1
MAQASHKRGPKRALKDGPRSAPGRRNDSPSPLSSCPPRWPPRGPRENPKMAPKASKIATGRP